MDRNTSISIIGPGKVGLLLKKSLSDAGFKYLEMISKGQPIEETGEWVFITTPDAVIPDIVEQILNTNVENKLIIHCSGTLTSDVFDELRSKGALTGCFHPIQSVTPTSDSFKGIYFDIEGDDEALVQLEVLADELGAKIIRVSKEQKKKLHVSAVIASNYLVTLTELANQVSSESGLEAEEVQQALLPLMNSVLNNLSTSSPSEALTGPIQRGDVGTVKEHVKLLKNKDKLLSIYKKLGLLTLELTDHSEKVKSSLTQILK